MRCFDRCRTRRERRQKIEPTRIHRRVRTHEMQSHRHRSFRSAAKPIPSFANCSRLTFNRCRSPSTNTCHPTVYRVLREIKKKDATRSRSCCFRNDITESVMCVPYPMSNISNDRLRTTCEAMHIRSIISRCAITALTSDVQRREKRVFVAD